VTAIRQIKLQLRKNLCDFSFDHKLHGFGKYLVCEKCRVL